MSNSALFFKSIFNFNTKTLKYIPRGINHSDNKHTVGCYFCPCALEVTSDGDIIDDNDIVADLLRLGWTKEEEHLFCPKCIPDRLFMQKMRKRRGNRIARTFERNYNKRLEVLVKQVLKLKSGLVKTRAHFDQNEMKPNIALEKELSRLNEVLNILVSGNALEKEQK